MYLSAVIPNYNGKELLRKNLPSVLVAVKNTEIIIVDDASTDGSVEFLKKNFPKIRLIEKITTNGFATTVNLGFKAATKDIVVLLNSDVTPHKDFLEYILPHFKDEKLFAVGCLDESIEHNNIVKRGRGVGNFQKGFLVHARGEVDNNNTLWVSGGSSVFRKSLWENLGGFDETYNPFYWEDIDVSYRALKNGYGIIFEPRAIVEHRHEEGSINQNFSKEEVKRIAYRNQFIFVWKNITDASYLLNHLIWLPYHLLTSLLGGNLHLLQGFFMALTKFPEILRRRKLTMKLFTKTDSEVLSKFTS